MEGTRTIVNHPPMGRLDLYLPGAFGLTLMVLLFLSLPGLLYSSNPAWTILAVMLLVIVISCVLIALTVYRTMLLTPSEIVFDDDRIEFHTKKRGVINARWRDLVHIRTHVSDNRLFSSKPRLGYRIWVRYAESRYAQMDVSREIAETMITMAYGTGIPDACPNLRLTGIFKEIPGKIESQRTYWYMLILLTLLVVLPSLLVMAIIGQYAGLLIVMIIPSAMAIHLLSIRRHQVRGRMPIRVDSEGLSVYLTAQDRRHGFTSPIRFGDIQRLRVLWDINAYTITDSATFRETYAIIVFKDGSELSLGARDSEAISFLAAAIGYSQSASSSI